MAADSALGLVRLIVPSSLFSIEALILLLCLLGSYLAVSSVYLAFFHPLAKIPGPKLCAITRIPYWQHSLKGNDVRWMHDLHKRYGPVLRFGPTDISYACTNAWKDVHGHEKGHKEMDKASEFSVQPINGMFFSRTFLVWGVWLDANLHAGVPSMLTATYMDHIRVRRLFSPAFSDRALKSQEPLFKK